MDATLSELDELCAVAFEQEDKIKAMEEAVSKENKLLSDLKAKILAIFEANDKEKYSVKNLGTIFTHNRFTVGVPKGEDKNKFFEYLRSKGIFEEMVSVHSATLNSYYQEEINAQLEAGNVDFKIPGIEEPKLVKTIRFRRS